MGGFEDAKAPAKKRKEAMRLRVGNDDEWIFRSATPPRGCGPEKHPFPSKAGRDRKQRDFALIYCRGLARYIREATRHLSFRLGGHTVCPGHVYIFYLPKILDSWLIDIFVYMRHGLFVVCYPLICSLNFREHYYEKLHGLRCRGRKMLG